MSQQHRAIHSRIIWSLVKMTLLLSVAYLLSSCENPARSNLGLTPSWHGITPGQTLASEAVAIWGKPDHTEMREGFCAGCATKIYIISEDWTIYRAPKRFYQVYSYLDRPDLGGWEIVELWAERRDGDDIIVGLFREWQGWDSRADVRTLGQLALQFERPDKVMWSDGCHSRYLVWARKGIAASVSAIHTIDAPDDYRVMEILLFEPMEAEQFVHTPWPFTLLHSAGWSTRNRCDPSSDHAPDTLPQDPYDWDRILKASK
jgi:hypothetical protein